MTQHVRRRVLGGLLGLGLLAGCGGAPAAAPLVMAPVTGPTVVVPQAVTLPALTGARLRPDVLVTGSMSAPQVKAVRALAHAAVSFTLGTARIRGIPVRVASVDPETFRRYAAAGTAEATAVWSTVAGGQLVASHAFAKRMHLALGRSVTLTAAHAATVRLGGLATTGIPGTDLVVDQALGARLGITGRTAVLLTAARTDPTVLAARARRAAGNKADIDLLTAPAALPTAFLTGSRAAHAFGAFSYRYYDDGTIVPDARWVRANIVTTTVPILGVVTCHRLLIPQLRAALRDVQKAGLASRLHSYNGCYVPRFMERDPSHPVSLHTWGIAIDLDAATNARGIRGTMDPRVVAIFKRWGFRWGGDWSWSDPMHFELGALLRTR